MAKEKHEKEYDLDKLHDDGQGCLTRHQKRIEGNRCSHLDTGRLRAEGPDWGVYGWPKYEAFCKQGEWKTAQRQSKKSKKWFPRGYGKKKPYPKEGEWDPGHLQNFKFFLEPYWNNAHHIIPNGSLRDAIGEAATTDARLDNLIRAGLLVADYNLNAQGNMVILPMEGIVAGALSLPRHLIGDQVGPNEASECFSHDNYNQQVQDKLTEIMEGFKRALRDALKNHPPVPKKLSKKKLERLQTTTRRAIFRAGKKSPGQALSSIQL